MHYYMIGHLFPSCRNVEFVQLLASRRSGLAFLFYQSYQGWREGGGEGSLPVHTCGRKRESGQFKAELLVS